MLPPEPLSSALFQGRLMAKQARLPLSVIETSPGDSRGQPAALTIGCRRACGHCPFARGPGLTYGRL